VLINVLDVQVIDPNKNYQKQSNPKRSLTGIRGPSKQSSYGQLMRKKSEIITESVRFYISYEIRIIDTGIGISQEGISNLFVDFGKLGENSQSNPQGTGLGLSICKQIIEQMGGSVGVES